MRILLTGNSKSGFIIDLRDQLQSQHPSICCDVLDPNNGNYLTSQGNLSIGTPVRMDSPLLQTLGLIRNYRAFRKYFTNNRIRYDWVNIHYLSLGYLFSYSFIAGVADKMAVSFYGSDFYIHQKIQLFFQKYFRKATAITFSNEQTRDDFNRRFRNCYAPKTCICRFGLPFLEKLQRQQEINSDKSWYKTQMGFPADRLVVQVGNSTNPSFRHTETIDLLMTRVSELKDKIFLVFPMSYGKYLNQVREVQDKMKDSPFQSIILTEYLYDEQLVALRLATDIVLNLQETDQLSGALMENLFVRNIVITGSWLPYEILDRKGISYIKIDRLKELPDVLLKTLEQIDHLRQLSAGNPAIIEELASWHNNIQAWINVYQS